MWEAAIGVVIGYIFGLWRVRRVARREVEQIENSFAARLESRNEEIVRLRDSFEKSQRAVSAYERRARYLESALMTTTESRATNGSSNGDRFRGDFATPIRSDT